MKRIICIIILILLLSSAFTARAEEPFAISPSYTCGPRYLFLNSVNEGIFDSLLITSTYQQKFGIKCSGSEWIASYCDSNYILVRHYDFSTSSDYVINKGELKEFQESTFKPFFPDSCLKPYMFRISSGCIDTACILFYVADYGDMTKTNVFIYNPIIDSLFPAPQQAYFPENDDTASVILQFQTTFERSDDGLCYGKIYDYSTAKAMTGNDSSDKKTSSKGYSLCSYSTETNEFKVICPLHSNLTRYKNNDSTTYTTSFATPWTYGYCWIEGEIVDYYKQSLYSDTLKVYDSRNDSIYSYGLRSYSSYPRNEIVQLKALPSGKILLSNSHNVIFIRDTAGNIEENKCFNIFYFDSCLTKPAFCGDKYGNIYCTFAYSDPEYLVTTTHEEVREYNYLLRLSPEGELLALCLGPECTRTEHVYGFLNTDCDMTVYEKDGYKYLCHWISHKHDYHYNDVLYLVYDLNFLYGVESVINGSQPALQFCNIYPDPASHGSKINISLTVPALESGEDGISGAVEKIAIYDLTGNEIADLSNSINFTDGTYSAVFDTSVLPSAGTYFAVAKNRKFSYCKKFVAK